MEIKKYIEEAAKTCPELGSYDENDAEHCVDLAHMALGIGTESGEIQDAIKKRIAYGVGLDLVNIAEEMGDIMWYLVNLARMLGIDFNEVLRKNIDKLRERYGEAFSTYDALHRDLDAEWEILSGETIDGE